MVVSFIGRGNRRTWRKPPTCHKSLTNFYHTVINQNQIHLHLIWPQYF